MSDTVTVSVIIPCYNEQNTIGPVLDALYRQSYPRADIEIIISDGLSTDQTRAVVAAYQASHPDLAIRLIDNPQRVIPSALNRAIDAARGEFLIRLDAHALPCADYIQRSVEGLQRGMGDNIGGVWHILPGGTSWVARSVAAAGSHPLGVGDALYRYATRPGLVDTVPFGAYRRALIDRVGKYDETLLTNEDYEFNTRIRQNGGKVWLDPAIQSDYYARSTYQALLRQYWRYGYWKQRMLRRYPGTLRLRQALPPLFVCGLLAGILAAPFWVLARILLLSVVCLYVVILLAAGSQTALKRKDSGLLFGLPLAIMVMHTGWGAGFLWSLLQSTFDKR